MQSTIEMIMSITSHLGRSNRTMGRPSVSIEIAEHIHRFSKASPGTLTSSLTWYGKGYS